MTVVPWQVPLIAILKLSETPATVVFFENVPSAAMNKSEITPKTPPREETRLKRLNLSIRFMTLEVLPVSNAELEAWMTGWPKESWKADAKIANVTGGYQLVGMWWCREFREELKFKKKQNRATMSYTGYMLSHFNVQGWNSQSNDLIDQFDQFLNIQKISNVLRFFPPRWTPRWTQRLNASEDDFTKATSLQQEQRIWTNPSGALWRSVKIWIEESLFLSSTILILLHIRHSANHRVLGIKKSIAL